MKKVKTLQGKLWLLVGLAIVLAGSPIQRGRRSRSMK